MSVSGKQSSSKIRRKDTDIDILFKVIIIGDSGVGKSCLLARYIKGAFISEHRVTIGTQFESKVLQLENFKVKLQIWDTAGQQTFRSIVKAFYRNSSAVMLVYNLANKKSFEDLIGWLKQAKENAPSNAFFVLVGTHSDLLQQREITKAEIQNFKSQNNIVLSFETSAKDNSNVNIAFEEIAAQGLTGYLQRVEKRKSTIGSPTKNLTLTTPDKIQKEQKSNCC